MGLISLSTFSIIPPTVFLTKDPQSKTIRSKATRSKVPKPSPKLECHFALNADSRCGAVFPKPPIPRTISKFKSISPRRFASADIFDFNSLKRITDLTFWSCSQSLSASSLNPSPSFMSRPKFNINSSLPLVSPAVIVKKPNEPLKFAFGLIWTINLKSSPACVLLASFSFSTLDLS